MFILLILKTYLKCYQITSSNNNTKTNNNIKIRTKNNYQIYLC